ncbi:S-layer homology domain-containing protein [Dehalobacterium formicoaceticum]|uniref:S-layer homology domain-containing protein n=1 Tax=Dehalobacterium formicoaceticum TaxID=51515 RepID=A0ABT1Y3F5_9FIRM|nr:S-layer homology domain-containing protein [Dehalobacterium formicoaceticum]MCR6545402.1 S-layer homology domain-containing protein [Dehalobacterium formicoaceticum]
MNVKKKSMAIAMILCLFFVFGTMALAAETSLTDVSGHWAEDFVVEWNQEGVVGGYPDGSFQPNREITRAEFITIINQALGCIATENFDFSDVQQGNWFYGEVAKAMKSGYMTGYPNGTFQPNSPISRQEAAIVFSRIMALENDEQGASDFTDVNKIPAWSKGLVGAVAEAGYMGGYPDGTFQPTKSITRAESVATLDRIIGEFYNEAGAYGSETASMTVEGNVTVTAADVTLENMVIKGNLYLAEGIGSGTVHLNNVTVEGDTIIRGGGKQSVIMYNFNGQTVIVDVPEGADVRILVQGTSTMTEVIMESDGILEEGDLTGSGFIDVIIPEDAEVVLIGTFNNVEITGPNVVLELEEGTIQRLTIQEDADDAQVVLGTGTSVTQLTVQAPATVTGEGSVGSARIESSNVTIEQAPTKVELADGVKNVNVDGKEIGDTEDTPGGNIGGGGGGGDGDSEPTISINEIKLQLKDQTGKVLAKEGTDSFEFSLAAEDDLTYFTGIEINGKYVNKGTLVMQEVEIDGVRMDSIPGFPGISLLSKNKATIDEQGYVSTNSIINEAIRILDPNGDGVSLKMLRTLGSEFVFKGYVERSGNSNSKAISVTLVI